MIEEAAAAGKHIFCEKPIAHDLGEIDRALAAVEKAGIKLQIGFNRRFDPNFRRVRELVATGKIGQPHILRITSRDPAPPPIEYIKVSGGIFLDMTIHDFDMARYLIGSDNSRRAAYGYDQRVEVFGSAGCASVDNNYPNTAVISDGQSVHRDLPLNFFIERYVESYIAEMKAFIECVQQDKMPPVTGIDGRIPVVMGYAAAKSYEENRPVRLDEISPVL
jgi:myo-inositol 2-dehydrogenase/D-chiro-inositol 1-dehydrogenase